MVISLNETDWTELCTTAQLHGENVYQKTMAASWFNLPHQFGQGGEQIICLHHGLTLSIRKGQLWQDLHLKRHHESAFPLVLKFFLSGRSRVHTANVPGVTSEYEEAGGYHYCYCLPELTEVEQWQAKEPIQMITVAAHPDYFQQWEQEYTILPKPLQKFIKADSIQPFHHNLGRTPTGMVQVLQQIMECPYQGWVQKMFLEGKALELLALQFAQWSEPQPSATLGSSVNPDDVERLHFASQILIQRASNPPSLLELARQVGLNDRKLKQGFRSCFGTTVFGYLQDYRLERSQQLLESGEMSVTEVAHAVGYASLPSFSKAFRKKFGHSPLACKTQHHIQKVRLG